MVYIHSTGEMGPARGVFAAATHRAQVNLNIRAMSDARRQQ